MMPLNLSVRSLDEAARGMVKRRMLAPRVAMAMEFIGLSPMGSASAPAVDQRKNAIGKEVGIDEPRAPLMPEGKVLALKELGREGGVAMVGDGVNDAPALAAASVGVAMGGAGSDVALETADVVLMSDDLRQLPFAVALAREANRTVRINLFISLGVSAVLILASIFGWVRISHAVVLHEGSTMVVVLNGLRLLLFRH